MCRVIQPQKALRDAGEACVPISRFLLMAIAPPCLYDAIRSVIKLNTTRSRKAHRRRKALPVRTQRRWDRIRSSRTRRRRPRSDRVPRSRQRHHRGRIRRRRFPFVFPPEPPRRITMKPGLSASRIRSDQRRSRASPKRRPAYARVAGIGLRRASAFASSIVTCAGVKHGCCADSGLVIAMPANGLAAMRRRLAADLKICLTNNQPVVGGFLAHVRVHDFLQRRL